MSQGALFLCIIFFLGRCSVRGIVFSKMFHCWHSIGINVSLIRSGSQQKPPGWFSINDEQLSRSFKQINTALLQRGKCSGRKVESFLGLGEHLQRVGQQNLPMVHGEHRLAVLYFLSCAGAGNGKYNVFKHQHGTTWVSSVNGHHGGNRKQKEY